MNRHKLELAEDIWIEYITLSRSELHDLEDSEFFKPEEIKGSKSPETVQWKSGYMKSTLPLHDWPGEDPTEVKTLKIWIPCLDATAPEIKGKSGTGSESFICATMFARLGVRDPRFRKIKEAYLADPIAHVKSNKIIGELLTDIAGATIEFTEKTL